MSELGKGFRAGFAASVTTLDANRADWFALKFEYFLSTVDNRRMSLSIHHALGASTVIAILLLAGCASEPPKPVKPIPSEPPKAITGRSAFYKMFPAARQWATDAQGLQMNSIYLQEVPGPPGTAGAWQAIFASAAKHKMKTFTWSAIDAPGNLKQGVFQNDEGDFNGKLDQAVPFFNQALHVDSDEAFKSLGVALLTGEPITFLLEFTPRFPDLTWRVIWGESVGSAKKSGFVDASTGKVFEKVR